MSTPHGPGPDARESLRPFERRWIDAVLWSCGGLAIAMAIAVVVGMESKSVELDLQLVAPPEGTPGRAIGTRAFVFDVSESRPRLVAAPVRLVLRTETGADLAEATLGVSAARGAEGTLSLTDVPSGRYELVADVEADGARAQVSAPLVVRATPEPAPREIRAILPVQGYRAFALRPEPDAAFALAADALEVRAVGGACVPDLDCTLLVRVGARPVEVAVEGRLGFERTDDVERAPPTTGIVRVEGVVRGPEAEVDVVAYHDDRAVARRTVRLEVLLGGVRVEVVEAREGRPVVEVLGADGDGVAVDLFRDGIWERASSVGHAAEPSPLEVPRLDPGRWVLQARTDPFGSARASTRVLTVAAGGGLVSPNDAGAFRSAMDERYIHPVPSAVSSVRAARAALAEQQERARYGTLVVVVLAALLVIALVFRRGLRGGAQARAILAEAGQADAGDPRRRWAMFLTVVAVALALAVAFSAIALWLYMRLL